MAKRGRPRKEKPAPINFKDELKAWRNKYETESEWVKNSNEKRTKYTNGERYRDYYPIGLGKWMEAPRILQFEILNHLPTIAYNYEYKSYEPLSMVSYLFNPSNAHKAIDTVMDHINIKLFKPLHDLTKDEVVVTNKKQLVEEVFNRKHNTIHIICPKANVSTDEELLYCKKLEWYYTHVIRRFLYMKANKTCANFFVDLFQR